jgi:hypothetical protein
MLWYAKEGWVDRIPVGCPEKPHPLRRLCFREYSRVAITWEVCCGKVLVSAISVIVYTLIFLVMFFRIRDQAISKDGYDPTGDRVLPS